MRKPIEYLTDIRTWIGLIVFFVMVGVAFAGFFKLPEKVKIVEKKQEETDDKVQSVAATLEKYISVEAVKDTEREKSEKSEKELMMKWISEVSRK